MNGYKTIKETAEQWGISVRRIQKMCEDQRIPGVVKFGRDWAIPNDAEKPADGRVKSGKYKNWRKTVAIR